jgi:hypothetical protein
LLLLLHKDHRQFFEAVIEGIACQRTGTAIIRFVGWNILRATLGCIVIVLPGESKF